MKNKYMIRVILADDHAIIRRGIRRILEKGSNICVIGEAGTGASAIQLVQELKPDVLLLDLELPDMKGHLVARALRMYHVPVSIIILSASDDDYFIKETLQGGVDGYLNKSQSPTEIRETVYRIYEKRSTVGVAALAMFLIPKIGWVVYQALHSMTSLPLDINLL